VTPIGVRRTLQRLGWSRLEAAAHLGKNEKTIRRWYSTGAPPHVARILSELAAGRCTVEQAAATLEGDYERRVA
jgi:ribosome-binding protein aMBF1 (putative translation factor)